MTDLVDAVPQLSQLVNSSTSLHIWVVARSDGAHAGGLITSVALRAVLKVGVWSARAVDTDVACCGYVRTPVRLGHDCYDCNA